MPIPQTKKQLLEFAQDIQKSAQKLVEQLEQTKQIEPPITTEIGCRLSSANRAIAQVNFILKEECNNDHSQH